MNKYFSDYSRPVTAATKSFFILILIVWGVSGYAQPLRDCRSEKLGLLRYVPSGEFQRDTNNNTISVVSSFYMSAQKITYKQFTDIIGFDIFKQNSESNPHEPVQRINWFHILVFCNKLSIIENLTPVYSINNAVDPDAWGKIPRGFDASWDAAQRWNTVRVDWSANGYRLPTETEWLWALVNSDSGAPIVQGKKETAYADSNNNADGVEVSTVLKREQTTDFKGDGISTLIGEWCWDWYAFYPEERLTNYTGPEIGRCRTIRYDRYPQQRYYEYPYFELTGISFRVVRH